MARGRVRQIDNDIVFVFDVG